MKIAQEKTCQVAKKSFCLELCLDFWKSPPSSDLFVVWWAKVYWVFKTRSQILFNLEQIELLKQKQKYFWSLTFNKAVWILFNMTFSLTILEHIKDICFSVLHYIKWEILQIYAQLQNALAEYIFSFTFPKQLCKNN